jgi:hypothetical protein
MIELLDELVPPFGDDGDWNDVLRRAGRRSRRPILLAAAAFAVAAVVVGPALGVLLTRHAAPRLPKGADKKNVVVMVNPVTGRILVQAAPWKGHDGICYVLLFKRAACVPRTPRGTEVVTPPIAGYTFDSRVVAGSAVTFAGKHVPLQVAHFPKLGVTFFLRRGRLPAFFAHATLTDASGKVVARYAFKH